MHHVVQADPVPGALDHLMGHMLTGCARSASRAAVLLDRMASEEAMDGEMPDICQPMREHLENGHV